MVTANSTGKSFNFFQKVIVQSASFQTNADVVFNFRGQQGFTLQNEGSGVVEYSFDGTTVHGDMDTAQPSKSLQWDSRRVGYIWFRLKSGATTIIRVEAWAAV